MIVSLKWTIFLFALRIFSSEAKCTLDDNLLLCSDADIKTAISEINNATVDYSLKSVDVLELLRVSFKNQTIKQGWLDNVKLKFDILNIVSTDLETIAPRAFVGSTFPSLKTLTFNDNNIKVLTKETLESLRINTFNFYSFFFQELIIEENALAAVAETLHTLTINAAINSQNLLNITGPNTSLPHLSRLDVAYGQIGDLKANSFVGAPNLRFLYLESSSITSVEEHTFDTALLGRLALHSNDLTTLPKNLFRYVLKGISINGNPWKCDCDLVWLKDMFIHYPSVFTHSVFYCTTPDGNIAYDQVEFCPNKLLK